MKEITSKTRREFRKTESGRPSTKSISDGYVLSLFLMNYDLPLGVSELTVSETRKRPCLLLNEKGEPLSIGHDDNLRKQIYGRQRASGGFEKAGLVEDGKRVVAGERKYGYMITPKTLPLVASVCREYWHGYLWVEHTQKVLNVSNEFEPNTTLAGNPYFYEANYEKLAFVKNFVAEPFFDKVLRAYLRASFGFSEEKERIPRPVPYYANEATAFERMSHLFCRVYALASKADETSKEAAALEKAYAEYMKFLRGLKPNEFTPPETVEYWLEYACRLYEPQIRVCHEVSRVYNSNKSDFERFSKLDKKMLKQKKWLFKSLSARAGLLFESLYSPFLLGSESALEKTRNRVSELQREFGVK